ncbi:MAG: gephyrin-like molybdotransferase Glp [Thermodesulfobacteriota bacterium]
MKDFFKVTDLDRVLAYRTDFNPVGAEEIPLANASGRVLAADAVSDVDLPDFPRSTMDGYAVKASSTYGASEGNPAYLSVTGSIAMGETPSIEIGPGEAARISTGGMLPAGADSIVMIEHAGAIDDRTIEVYRSAAPGQHVIEIAEDFQKDAKILGRGRKLRPQEVGLLAAFGRKSIAVFKKPRVAVISTGDEIIPIDQKPGRGQVRDINTYTLSCLLQDAGAVPIPFGIVRDNADDLFRTCARALDRTDMVLISGGSSVGVRDYSIDVLSALPDPRILVHGISISPGKPTILARSGPKALWGLPGHVVSAMVVFTVVVRPFVEHIGGLDEDSRQRPLLCARLSRNVPSAQGRVDFIRVKLTRRDGILWAHPVLGKSGLINTMVKADGLIQIGINTEGLDEGTEVEVLPL